MFEASFHLLCAKNKQNCGKFIPKCRLFSGLETMQVLTLETGVNGEVKPDGILLVFLSPKVLDCFTCYFVGRDQIVDREDH